MDPSALVSLAGALLVLLAGLGVLAGFFILLRATALWYWHIDEIVALLRELRDDLAYLAQAQSEPPTSSP